MLHPDSYDAQMDDYALAFEVQAMEDNLWRRQQAQKQLREEQDMAFAFMLQANEAPQLVTTDLKLATRLQEQEKLQQNNLDIQLAYLLQRQEEEDNSLCFPQIGKEKEQDNKFQNRSSDKAQPIVKKTEELQRSTSLICDIEVAYRAQKEHQGPNNSGSSRRTTDHTFLKDVIRQSLKPCQYQAIKYVERQAQILHEESVTNLLKRTKSLGFTEQDLHQCLDYIQNDAPIIIHLHQSTLSLLNHDTHYRNMFETRTSGGNRDFASRRNWEKVMFGGFYSGCGPFDRPKYGCLNITGDIMGDTVAKTYGSMYLVLAPNVRYRATLYNEDSSAFGQDMKHNRSLATCEKYAHILDQYNDDDLRIALNMSKSSSLLQGIPSPLSTYKEVQIHGPICLATDIQALSVPGQSCTASSELRRDVLAFQKKTGCNILWQGDL